MLNLNLDLVLHSYIACKGWTGLKIIIILSSQEPRMIVLSRDFSVTNNLLKRYVAVSTLKLVISSYKMINHVTRPYSVPKALFCPNLLKIFIFFSFFR